MLKITITTTSGLKCEGWLRSDKDLWFINSDNKVERWQWAEGDKLEINADIDSADVPVEVKALVNKI